jgi:hypothetical protein
VRDKCKIIKYKGDKKMAEILSQAEIDALLSSDTQTADILSQDEIDAILDGKPLLEIFVNSLTKRKFTPEKPYGIFDKDITVCRYFSSNQNENILEDIKRKNEAEGYGNVSIPNTDIMLINYSFCQKCGTVFSFKEITEYYKNPLPDKRYLNRAHQYRNDTRVHCNNCGTYFLPALIISDGTPLNEVQFLCRSQTVNAVEKYLFVSKNVRVLTENKKNIILKDNLKAIKNDVLINDLDQKPTLITNIIQYTPYNYIMNFVNGSNVKKGDLLFDEWR